MRAFTRRLTAGSAAAALAVVGLAGPAMADHTATPPADFGSAGDDEIIVPINDSAAGGTYYQSFTKVYDDATDQGTPVFVYVPTNDDGLGHSMDPGFDHNPDDTFVPCDQHDPADYVVTQTQIDYLGNELRDQIVAVDEAHFGSIGLADADNPDSKSLVTLVYNVQDDGYYDCAETSYTAGYFAPDFMTSMGMNVITLDSFDWANRVGSPGDPVWTDDGDTTNDRPELYEGVIAHELEHLLMNYSDSGELSWVDEGLADTAAFLNGYDMTGSHLTYQQVFHRETSLTRWGGGLENYGASFSYFAYLWEQAGGNGDGTLVPDGEYDAAGGDLLIKKIFAEQADGMDGVQKAIDEFRSEGGSVRDADELFQDWAVTMYVDDEDSSRWDLENFDLGPASGGWTIDVANDEFWGDRGSYKGSQPESKWSQEGHRPDGTALPFGVSYEKFSNPGPRVALEFDGADGTQVAPKTGEKHWWGGYASQSDTELNLDTAVSGGETVSFWNWHFIEEGWDYGFVDALVNGEWETVPVELAGTDTVVSTNTNPHGNNEEGNGITGTSGGEYFVNEPQYVHYEVELPAGATDVRWRYSTDAAYLDTGWFIDDVTVNGATGAVSSTEWIETTGEQDNNWTVQVISSCDLTPGSTTAGELIDGAGNFVYRFAGDEISTYKLNTKCANGAKTDFVVSVSNLPTGDLAVLDATYDYTVVKK